MALITCPECGKQVSDTAPSCVQCGYAYLQTLHPDNPKRTVLTAKKKMKKAQTALIVGLVFTIVGIFTIPIGIGIVFIIFGFGCGFAGLIMKTLNMQTGNCPYCNAPAKVQAEVRIYRCKQCKNKSTKGDDYLEVINQPNS